MQEAGLKEPQGRARPQASLAEESAWWRGAGVGTLDAGSGWSLKLLGRTGSCLFEKFLGGQWCYAGGFQRSINSIWTRRPPWYMGMSLWKETRSRKEISVRDMGQESRSPWE